MLVICSHCRRHYRHGEAKCPFCGSTKPAVTRHFGVGLAVAISVTAGLGCGGEDTGPADPGGASNESGGTPATGGTTPATGGTTYNTGRGGTTGYGGAYAVPPSGGRPATGGVSTGGVSTGGVSTGGTGMVALYGPPPTGGAGSAK